METAVYLAEALYEWLWLWVEFAIDMRIVDVAEGRS